VRAAARWNVPREGDLIAQRYRVEETRGQRGHELMLIALHVDLGQRVIVRVLSPEANEHAEIASRFQRAARKALEARSEHAERVIDFGRLESGLPYRVSELPHGPSLAEILQARGALPIQEAANVALAVCEAIAEGHAAGNAFTNLCPANIFVERRTDGAPLAKIVDYPHSGSLHHEGLAGHELAIPGADLMSGSLPYTAPEQLRHPSSVDARADVWAFGAIAYELLVGRAPFRSESPVALLTLIAADPPMPPSAVRFDLPHELEDMVLACLRKDPNERPQSMAELIADLLPFISPEFEELALRVERMARRSWRPSARAENQVTPLPNSSPASFNAPSYGAANSTRSHATFSAMPSSRAAQRGATSQRPVNGHANGHASQSEGLRERRSSLGNRSFFEGSSAEERNAERGSLDNHSATPATSSKSTPVTNAAPVVAKNPWAAVVIAVALSTLGAVATTVLLRESDSGMDDIETDPLAEQAPAVAPVRVEPPRAVEPVPAAQPQTRDVPATAVLPTKATISRSNKSSVAAGENPNPRSPSNDLQPASEKRGAASAPALNQSSVANVNSDPAVQKPASQEAAASEGTQLAHAATNNLFDGVE
jgi:serine/threonine-protein kinase